ncbi:MAG: phosphatase PAP2 family protein [Candidatus Wildermuthbacteria bacterium]|nr:phosphatase PAP2 family protein [Candidatus Wildermuthbacteria bacterium]
MQKNSAGPLHIIFSNLAFTGITARNFLFILLYVPFLIGAFHAGRFFLLLIFKDRGKSKFFDTLHPSLFRNRFLQSFKNFLFLGVPAIAALYLLGFALGALSEVRAFSLTDEFLMQADRLLTGSYPFIALGNIAHPAWFVALVSVFYLCLGILLLVFAVHLFIEKQGLFRECAGAFFLGMMMMFALWWVFPALTPRQRFLDNVFRLPVPSQVQQALSLYRPQKEIVSFFDTLRQEEKNISVFVVSNMPSAHIAWAVLLVYYAYRAFPLLLIAIIPFAVLSSYGTLLFAQHYFIDIPAGLLVGIVSILIAHFMARISADEKEKKL